MGMGEAAARLRLRLTQPSYGPNAGPLPSEWPRLSATGVGGRTSCVRSAATSASIRWRATSATTSAAVSAPGRSSLSCLLSVFALALTETSLQADKSKECDRLLPLA